MATLFVDKVDPQSGTSLEIGSSGDTVTIPSGCTLTNSGTATGFPDNTPAWKIGMSSSQSLSYNTTTKINFDTSIIDTDSGVDTTNKRYTIPSGEAGKYIVHCFYRTGTGTDSASFDIFVYKNGSLLNDAEDMQSFTVSQSYNTVQCTGMLDLSAGDYLEMYARQADQNFTASIGYSNEARFWGYKLIGV